MNSRLLAREVEVGTAPFVVYKIMLMVFGCVFPARLIKVDQGSLFWAIFDENGRFFEIFSRNFSQKLNQNGQHCIFCL